MVGIIPKTAGTIEDALNIITERLGRNRGSQSRAVDYVAGLIGKAGPTFYGYLNPHQTDVQISLRDAARLDAEFFKLEGWRPLATAMEHTTDDLLQGQQVEGVALEMLALKNAAASGRVAQLVAQAVEHGSHSGTAISREEAATIRAAALEGRRLDEMVVPAMDKLLAGVGGK